MPINEADLQAEMAKAEVQVRNWTKRLRRWTKEQHLSGQFRARNEATDELPPAELVDRIYLLTWRADGKPIVVRHGDASQPWQVPTAERDRTAPTPGSDGAAAGTPPEQPIDDWITAAARDLWGIQLKDWYQHSRLKLTATDQATDVEPGGVRYYLFLCATAAKLDDIPEGAGWSRRAITTREFNPILRERYYEFEEIMDAAHDGYLIRRGKQRA